jgi:N-sulfoglucosamine sulfohydrolase
VRTLPVLLTEGGYRTCSIGKYHVAPDYVYKFEAYRNEGTQGARNTVRMAQNAKEWIAEKDERPFFLYFCPTDPHRGGGADKFSNFNEDPDRYTGVKREVFDPKTIPVPEWLPDQPEVRQELAEYYQAIARMDQGIAKLLDALKETGHWEDTLVIFASDNGPPFPGAKTTLYQPGANLPLIVRDPSAKPGVTDARVTWADCVPTILDFCGVKPAPGAPLRKVENSGERVTQGPQGRAVPYANHGRSFLKAMRDEHPADRDEIFLSHTFHEITMYYPMRSVVSGRYKYIFNIAHGLPYPFASDLYASPTWQASLKRQDTQYGLRSVEAYIHRPRHELYDLQADPHELKNLAEDTAYKAMLESLQAKVKAFQEQTSDPWVSKWEYE